MNILQLLPQGKLWIGKNIQTLFLALEDSLLRVKKESGKILLECFPETTESLLADWMRICQSKTREGVLSTLAATGGNREEFFLSVARKFDSQCQILHVNPNAQFTSGISCSGMSLGQNTIPKFTSVFRFSCEKNISEAERLLNNLKPAHIRFVYLYARNKDLPFVAGISFAGESLNITNFKKEKQCTK